jgi:hypothetical protein
VSAGLWVAIAFGVSVLTGSPAPAIGSAVADAAILGVSSIGSDYVHSSMMWQSGGVSDAAATGIIFAALERAYRGDTAYLTNAVVAGGNQYIVERWYDYQEQARWMAAQAEAEEQGL